MTASIFCLPKRGSDTFHSDGAVKDRGEAANEEQGRFEIQNVGKRFSVEETAVVVGNRLYLTTPPSATAAVCRHAALGVGGSRICQLLRDRRTRHTYSSQPTSCNRPIKQASLPAPTAPGRPPREREKKIDPNFTIPF
jgi:hypothetical protein